MQNSTSSCPHCLSALDMPEELYGKEVECPICKKTFVVPNPYGGSAAGGGKNLNPAKNPKGGRGRSLLTVMTLIVALVALALSVVTFLMKINEKPFYLTTWNKDPNVLVQNLVKARVTGLGRIYYFFAKNGDAILDSLKVKEIKTNGDWGAAFYTLSLGATEVRQVMFMHKSRDGYWEEVGSRYQVKERAPEKWFKDMENKSKKFVGDSPDDFDEWDI